MSMSLSANHSRKIAVIFASTVTIGLSGCVSDMQDPKYPVYMESVPVTQAEATQASSSASDYAPEVTAAGSQGDISARELAPPPPPPPPTEQELAAKPVPASYATTTKPVVKETQAAFSYTVAAQDTVYGVSRRFGVPVKAIFEMNDLNSESKISVGQKILLPKTAKDNGLDPHANGAGLVKLAIAVASDSAVKPVADSAKPTPSKPMPPAPTPVKPETKPVAVITPTPKTVTTQPTPKPVTPQVNSGFPSAAQLKAMAKGMFDWPIKGKILFPFGQLKQNIKNDGINIAAARGTQVLAAGDGVVVYQGNQVKALGNTVYIKHDNGWYTGYSHLETMAVKNNQRISRGDVIGTVGAPTASDPGQLHFEVRYTPNSDVAKPIDPVIVLP